MNVTTRVFCEKDQKAVRELWISGFYDTGVLGSICASARLWEGCWGSWSRKWAVHAGVITACMATCAARVILGASQPVLIAAAVAAASAAAWLIFLPLAYQWACHALRKKEKGSDMDTIMQTWVEPANRCLWVAEQGQEIVGLTAVHIGPEGAPTMDSLKKDMQADHGMLFRMSTKSSCRRQGVGLKLMKEVENFVKLRSIAQVSLVTANTQAVVFYKKAGYNVIKETLMGSMTLRIMLKKF